VLPLELTFSTIQRGSVTAWANSLFYIRRECFHLSQHLYSTRRECFRLSQLSLQYKEGLLALEPTSLQYKDEVFPPESTISTIQGGSVTAWVNYLYNTRRERFRLSQHLYSTRREPYRSSQHLCSKRRERYRFSQLSIHFKKEVLPLEPTFYKIQGWNVTSWANISGRSVTAWAILFDYTRSGCNAWATLLYNTRTERCRLSQLSV
jgi:hypothetical protein